MTAALSSSPGQAPVQEERHANSFCKELPEQHNVQIDFSHAGVPRNLSNEIPLCLFRVLQESLQDAVKHSGVRHFELELFGTPRDVRLVVKDLGVGFDQQDAMNRYGLGLISMGERPRDYDWQAANFQLNPSRATAPQFCAACLSKKTSTAVLPFV